jgi:hypothetical protein
MARAKYRPNEVYEVSREIIDLSKSAGLDPYAVFAPTASGMAMPTTLSGADFRKQASELFAAADPFVGDSDDSGLGF